MKVSLDNALKNGYKRMVKILFKPFNLVSWLIFGFASFLASLGKGGGVNFNLRLQNLDGKQAGNFAIIEDWLKMHIFGVFLVIVGIVVIALALFLLFTWLSSRGKFMFIYQIANNKAEIQEPWSKYGHLADRLFVFRLIFGFVIFFVFLAIVLFAILLLYPNIKAEQFGFSFFGKLFFSVFLLIVFVLLSVLINAVLLDFVVPLMFKKEVKVLQGFTIFYKELFKENIGSFLLFYLLKIGLSIAASFVVLIGIFLTCCIASLPYISSVVFLPISVFLESFTLSFLAEFGEEYNLFSWKIDVEKDNKINLVNDNKTQIEE